MLRLLYFSQATQTITDEDVQDILTISQRNNSPLGITGVLVYGAGIFLQVLEGPEKELLRQYVKIIDDKRHRECKIIYISPVEERIFKNWSMGVIQCDETLGFEHIMALRALRHETTPSKEFTNAMQWFLRTLNAEKKNNSPK